MSTNKESTIKFSIIVISIIILRKKCMKIEKKIIFYLNILFTEVTQ